MAHWIIINAFQDGSYSMDQEFDGKGLTPYDPAHNSTYLLAGKIVRALHSQKKRKEDVLSFPIYRRYSLIRKSIFGKIERNTRAEQQHTNFPH